jgi:two-component system, cell cycle response regulator CpdR
MSEIAPRVLVAEDDEAVRGFLSRALERGGCEPIGVRTGEEALHFVRTPPGVALALIDGLLPDMHGVRLARRMLEEPSAARVALCFVSGAIREHRPAVAGVAALSKPVRLREFLEALEVLLEWHRGPGDPREARLAALQQLEQSFLVGP